MPTHLSKAGEVGWAVREDIIHSNMPQWQDDGIQMTLSNQPSNSPFEAQELRTHVYFPFWEDVHPVPMVKLLQNEVHPFLVDTISSTHRHTFAQAEEMGVQLLGEADVCSCWGPTHQLQVPDVAEF